MITKCVAFLVVALVLANCCAMGGGCAPLGGGPGGPVALDDDGLGEAPREEAQPSNPPPKQNARPKRKNMVGALDAGATRQNLGAQPKDQFELEQAADQADDLRLKRKLMICSDC